MCVDSLPWTANEARQSIVRRSFVKRAGGVDQNAAAMLYLDLFDRRARLMDELLLIASKLPPSAFAEPGPAAGPSLRDLQG